MVVFSDNQAENLIKTVYRSAKKKKMDIFLVGGYLRDVVLNRKKDCPDIDIDFCLKSGAVNFGRKLAREIKAAFVILDKEHGCCRLIKKISRQVYTLDITDFRGKTIAEDLAHRDFTINAMALELGVLFSIPGNKKGVFPRKNLIRLFIDPYGGKEDLKLGIIRLVNKISFDEDPLRILRAFSLSVIFGFKIEKETLASAVSKRGKLSAVSYERIRDELFKIFDRPDSLDCLSELDRTGILKTVIPEIEVMKGVKQGPYHHLDVWKHTLEAVRQFEILLQEVKRNRELKDYLNEVISGERKRRALLKLGLLLHDVGKPKAIRREGGKVKFHGHERIGLGITRNVARRLKLSNDEMNSLGRMVLWHLRPGYLADNEELTPRAVFRYFRDSAAEGAGILLMSIADQRATRGILTSKESKICHEKVTFGLIKEYFRRKREKKQVRLINGNDLMRKFGLKPSPLIGKILLELDELQAIGRIKTKKEALRTAERVIGNFDK